MFVWNLFPRKSFSRVIRDHDVSDRIEHTGSENYSPSEFSNNKSLFCQGNSVVPSETSEYWFFFRNTVHLLFLKHSLSYELKESPESILNLIESIQTTVNLGPHLNLANLCWLFPSFVFFSCIAFWFDVRFEVFINQYQQRQLPKKKITGKIRVIFHVLKDSGKSVTYPDKTCVFSCKLIQLSVGFFECC